MFEIWKQQKKAHFRAGTMEPSLEKRGRGENHDNQTPLSTPADVDGTDKQTRKDKI
jgi:hypothetical protein